MSFLSLPKFVAIAFSGTAISMPMVFSSSAKSLPTDLELKDFPEQLCHQASTKDNSEGKLLVCTDNQYYLYKNSLQNLRNLKVRDNQISAELQNSENSKHITLNWIFESDEWGEAPADISLTLSSINKEGEWPPKGKDYCLLTYEKVNNEDAKIFCVWSNSKEQPESQGWGFINLTPFPINK